ncbi:MAG: class II aldolase/adducin family protein [Gammaproteobacteria bacterium]
MNASVENKDSGVKGVVSNAEWQTRVELAAAYRLVAMFGWDDLIFTHISARVPDAGHHFLVNPYGLLFEEINASNLVKVDLDGNKVLDSPHPVNPAGFVIHSAVHAARDDAQCVIHLHTNEGIAVSIQPDGLRPLSQTSLFAVADIAYHDYEGVALNDEEKPRLVADLGQHSYLILRNHGTLTTGRSVGEAFLAMYILQRACEIQMLASAGGADLIPVPEAIIDGIKAQASQVTLGQGAGLAWPALLRRLDRKGPSYRE